MLWSYHNKTSMALTQKQCVDHWSGKENPEINLQSWNHLILGKDDKTRHWKRDSSSSGLEETELTERRLKLGVLPHPVQHWPKWIKHFHVRSAASSCQKAEGNISWPGHKQWLQRKIHIAKQVIVFICKWNCMKLKNFYTANKTLEVTNRIEGSIRKGLMSRVHKELNN